MMAEHNDLGVAGEHAAAEHLIKNGYKIIARNWRYGREEIDIIATKDEWLVFVEVKTRTTDKFGFPEEAIGRKKQKSIIKVADAYLKLNNCNKAARFDVITVISNQFRCEINHIEDAFLPF